MKKITLLILLISTNLFAQRASITGVISDKIGIVPNAHVINVTSNEGTFSNQKGYFLTRLLKYNYAIKEYKKALTQEKSLFNRKPGSLERIQEIGYISFENKDYETAANAFEFMLSKEEEVIIDDQALLFAEIYLLKIENNTLKKGENRAGIEAKFEELIREYGYREETLELHLAYADFLTFDYNMPEKAIQHLEIISERAETPLF